MGVVWQQVAKAAFQEAPQVAPPPTYCLSAEGITETPKTTLPFRMKPAAVPRRARIQGS